MKNFFLVATMIVALIGCSNCEQVQKEEEDSMTLVHIKTDNGFSYYYDKETKVMYGCRNKYYSDNMFVLLDSCGNPRLYNPEINR